MLLSVLLTKSLKNLTLGMCPRLLRHNCGWNPRRIQSQDGYDERRVHTDDTQASTNHAIIELLEDDFDDDNDDMYATLSGGSSPAQTQFQTLYALSSPVSVFSTTAALQSNLNWLRELNLDIHFPDVSFLVARDPTRDMQLPWAVKIGRPLKSDEVADFNFEEDIWVVPREDEERGNPKLTWTPPRINEDVLQSDRFRTWLKLVELATQNTKAVGNKAEKKQTKIYSTNQELKEFHKIVNESLPKDLSDVYIQDFQMMLDDLFYSFYFQFKQAIELGWPDGEGRGGISSFLNAAINVCKKYKLDTGKGGVIRAHVLNLGGEGPKNIFNCRCGVRKATIAGQGVKDRNAGLRQTQDWIFNSNWRFQQFTPDAVLVAVSEDKDGITEGNVGLLSVEIKSGEESDSKSLTQAYLQALQGLALGPQTAAIVMSPTHAYFIHITVEKGVIVKKTKQYNFVQDYQVGQVDPAKYKELFQDVVLYLWNMYYE